MDPQQPATMKICKRCGLKKQLKEFYSWYDAKSFSFRHQSICKKCRAKQRRDVPDPEGLAWIEEHVVRKKVY